jgi:hypothetical protein
MAAASGGKVAIAPVGLDLDASARRGRRLTVGYNIMLQALPINGKIVLRLPKTQTEEPAQPPARENPRRDTNRGRRKDK